MDLILIYLLYVLISLFLTATTYMAVPVIVRLIKGKISKKSARIVCIINCVVVAIAWMVIQFLWGAESSNPTAAFFWFFPGYWLLRDKTKSISTKKESADQESKSTNDPVQSEQIEEETICHEEEALSLTNPELINDIKQKQDDIKSASQNTESKESETTCSNCNKKIPSEYEFCPYCGQRMTASNQKVFHFNRHFSIKRLSTKTAIIVFIVAALLFISTIVIVTVLPGIVSSNTSQTEVTTAKKYSYYIGNKSTKIYHDPDCKYLPSRTNQVKIQKNRSGMYTLNDYEPCWHCQPEPPELN